jgi:beta-lactam-binding protein with PASTA domain
VVGLTQANAEAAIVAAGLVVGTVTTAYDADGAGGRRDQPEPGRWRSALPGTAVDLVVSLGVAPVGCRMWWA